MARKTRNALVNKTWSRGWEPGDWRPLVAWLNHAAAEPAAVKRIAKVIELLAQSRDTTDEQKRLAIWRDGLLVELRRYGKQYAYVTEPPWRFGFRPERGPVVQVRVGEDTRGYSEGDAVVTVQRLQEMGQDAKLRRCTECSRWIFVRFQRMKFCSKRCQERYYKRNPEFLKKRAAYMKKKMAEYRQRDKEQDTQFLKKQRQPQRKTQPQRRKSQS
jgi:hypothetical protein